MSNQHVAWQTKLLPYMIGAVFFFAVLFLAGTMYQLQSLKSEIKSAPQIQSDFLYQNEEDFERHRWNSLVALEVHVLQQRYHQANISILSRLWVRYLGFVTGMILAFIGAIFIIGKLREEARINVEGQGLKASLATQSPGIVLAVLGVVLMVVTIVVNHKVDVRDSPSYTQISMTTTKGALKKEAPEDLDLNENQTQETLNCPSLLELTNKPPETLNARDMQCITNYQRN